MDTFNRSETDEKETEQVRTLLSELINRLKTDTKASEKVVRNLLQEYAESV